MDDRELMELFARRYSVRSFAQRPVAQEDVEAILRAGHLAPTGCNNQPQRILVMRSAQAMEKLRRCTRCHFGAPMAMLVCYDECECWRRPYDGRLSGEVDAAIVTTHMMLEACARGVGTTWVMHFNPQKMRQEFNIPSGIDPVALLVMGYPAPDAQPYPGHSQFRLREELVVEDSF